MRPVALIGELQADRQLFGAAAGGGIAVEGHQERRAVVDEKRVMRRAKRLIGAAILGHGAHPGEPIRPVGRASGVQHLIAIWFRHNTCPFWSHPLSSR